MHNYVMLKEIRKNKKLRQRELAKMSGVNQATISRIERGELRPRWDIAVRIARSLETPPEEIFPVEQNNNAA